MWTEEQIQALVEGQRRFFRTGTPLDVGWRLEQLRRLKQAVLANETAIEEALAADLGRSPVEAYFCDVGSIVLELNEMLHGLRRWARPELHFSGLTCFPSRVTRVYKLPYGVSLIISPFNFPFLLSLGVLGAAIAGGNTAVIKASSKSVRSTEVLKRIVSETFPEDYVALVDGGHDAAELCLSQRFDKLFYTGSPRVGVRVMEAAAKHLTPRKRRKTRSFWRTTPEPMPPSSGNGWRDWRNGCKGRTPRSQVPASAFCSWSGIRGRSARPCPGSRK